MNRKHSITGHGGVQLCVHDLGPETAPAIILVHGWSQCHLSFVRQSELAERFRLILPDLRGHGQSDKPLDPACYDNSRPWAEDMQAIITSKRRRSLPLMRPLWQKAQMPQALRAHWQNLQQSLLRDDENWQFWIDFYDGI
ncbi:alpha/beta fold hydrolase [Planktomarina sp.]|uniref:alpha/beta fold hydrolase n=1 Tax=Planktomarina sp. TaxID=2024851 RepID=UPI0032608F0D